MNLYHFSHEVVTFVREWDYSAQGGHLKPQGFWVSIEDGDGWSDYCRGVDVDLERLTYKHSVTLASGARILYLTTVEDIGAFHHQYAEPYIPGHPQFLQIAWAKVATEYQGIIITPYQWSLRLSLEYMWYGGWDCASGCIWDLNAIDSVDLAP